LKECTVCSFCAEKQKTKRIPPQSPYQAIPSLLIVHQFFATKPLASPPTIHLPIVAVPTSHLAPVICTAPTIGTICEIQIPIFSTTFGNDKDIRKLAVNVDGAVIEIGAEQIAYRTAFIIFYDHVDAVRIRAILGDMEPAAAGGIAFLEIVLDFTCANAGAGRDEGDMLGRLARC